jgi:hypothetical protein
MRLLWIYHRKYPYCIIYESMSQLHVSRVFRSVTLNFQLDGTRKTAHGYVEMERQERV